MLLNVRVHASSSRSLVKQGKDVLEVYLTKPPREGLANKQLIELLSEHFKVKKYQIRITKGQNSRNKFVEIS